MIHLLRGTFYDRDISGFFAIPVNKILALSSMCQTTGTADTSAHAGHTLDEIDIKPAMTFPNQSQFAFFQTIAADRLQVEIINSLFFQRFGYRFGKSAAAGKDPAKI